MATNILHPKMLEALVAYRNLPFYKNLGVCPIDVGEVIRCIIGKSFSWVLRKNISQAAGPL